MKPETMKFTLSVRLEVCHLKAPPKDQTATLTHPVPYDKESFISTQKAVLHDIQAKLLWALFENFCEKAAPPLDSIQLTVDTPDLPSLSVKGYSLSMHTIHTPGATLTKENAISRMVETELSLEKWVGDVLLALTLPLLSSGSAS